MALTDAKCTPQAHKLHKGLQNGWANRNEINSGQILSACYPAVKAKGSCALRQICPACDCHVLLFMPRDQDMRSGLALQVLALSGLGTSGLGVTQQQLDDLVARARQWREADDVVGLRENPSLTLKRQFVPAQ